MSKRSLFRKMAMAVFLLYSSTSYAQYNYEDALAKSILFFDGNKCGPNVASNNVYPWRTACHTTDGSTVGLDLSGGFHDAGDHVKFGLPQTWTAATLGFALYEFRDAFDKSNATTKTLSTLKYFTDFFLKCNVNANTFYYNVGDGNADHGYWGSPELQTGTRPVIAATASKPASDVCGEAAAALALMYLNYKDVDLAYATQCLNAAKQIFQNGKTNLGRSDDGGGGAFYKSSSHFDDLSWGAIWLSIATGDQSYLTPVPGWLDTKNDYGDDPYDKHWAPAWDDVTVYALVKMYQLTGTQKYYDGVIKNLEWYRDKCARTPAGLPWLNEWGVLRYASSEAGVGYLAAQKFEYAGYLATGDFTMDYTLGGNPQKRSYLTNWGTNPPIHPHHRANEPVRGGAVKGLIGGLVGGPGTQDDYVDDVGDFHKNEVALDYNASFILGMAGRIYFKYHTPPKVNVPPTVALTAPTGGTFSQGAPVTFSANASDSDGTITKVEFYVSGAKVGEDATAPYSFIWTSQLAGSYSITARAIDNKNGSATSTAVNITVTSDTPPPTTPNLALNKPATASSLENAGFPASNAFDGSGGSRWSSAFADPQWLSVDLGSALTINRTILNWEGASGKVYQIQVSTNGTTWTAVASIAGGNGGIDDIVFPNVSARYVRMYGTERNTPYGYSLLEFEVYGPAIGGNIAPTASITAPANGASFTAGANITISANASDTDGSVAKVEFFSNGTKLGEDATAPYSYSWTNVAAGSYSLTAVATDNQALTGTSSIIAITVNPIGNVAPTASITSPANGATFALGTAINIAATANDTDGTIAKVEFFAGATKLGEDTASPYTFSWTNAAATNYSLTVVATDNLSAKGTSAAVNITVNSPGNISPTASITSPAAGASFNVGTAIAIAATANDTDGTIAKVEFFAGATKLGEDATAPYTFSWASATAGVYSLTAVATDNLGAKGTSVGISITVSEVGGGNCKFGTPLAAALPTLSASYTKVHKLGTGGPALSNVTNCTINWDLANNGLWQLSFNTNNGIPTWYIDLRTVSTFKFNSAQPEITFTSSGFPGLDGAYWVAKDGTNLALVSKTGGFTIYFSNSATPPSCTAARQGFVANSGDSEVSVFPNPSNGEFTLNVGQSKVKSIKVVNQSGRIVERVGQEKISSGTVHVGKNLQPGLYIIHIQRTNGSKALKVIKQ